MKKNLPYVNYSVFYSDHESSSLYLIDIFLILSVAVADDIYGYATTSWYLAETVSHIELNTESMTKEEVARIEETANQKIREATPVSIVEFKASDPELNKVCVQCMCPGNPDLIICKRTWNVALG